MIRKLGIVIFLLGAFPAVAEDCAISDMDENVLAIVKTNGAVGYYNSNDNLVFAGITHTNVVSGQENSILTNPWILRRGRTRYCVMTSFGWSDEEGVVYNYAGEFKGQIRDDGGIYDENNEQVGSYNQACQDLPLGLRQRILTLPSFILLADEQNPSSRYLIGYNPEVCDLGYHPGVTQALVRIDPLGPNLGYSITRLR